MDCVVLPSYSEGFGSVLIEAASFGIPAIATRVPGCIDAVVDGKTGWLVEPHDDNGLGAAIMQAFDHPDSTRNLGRNARERAEMEFRQEMIWTGYADMYTELSHRDCTESVHR